MVDFKQEKFNTLDKFIREELTDSEIIDIYNDYAERNGYDLVYPNDEEIVDMFISEMGPYEILCAGANYDSGANFICGGIARIFNCWDDADSPIYIGEIIDEMQESDAFSDSTTIVDGFLDAMEKSGYNRDDVKSWFEDEYCGNLTEDDWLDVSEEYEEFVYNRWFSGTEFKELEKITGLRQDDFSPEDGYQDFVDACHDWWDNKNREEKEIVFNQFN